MPFGARSAKHTVRKRKATRTKETTVNRRPTLKLRKPLPQGWKASLKLRRMFSQGWKGIKICNTYTKISIRNRTCIGPLVTEKSVWRKRADFALLKSDSQVKVTEKSAGRRRRCKRSE
jgi:hypothetical protein